MTHHEKQHPQCSALLERLSEYLDQELDVETCEEVERHLAACGPCAVCLETLKKTVELCRGMGKTPPPRRLSVRLRRMLQDM